jgi:hypothetical protein
MMVVGVEVRFRGRRGLFFINCVFGNYINQIIIG